jgi:hypothetical protein
MRIIDARSGKDVKVGDVIDYGQAPVCVYGPPKPTGEKIKHPGTGEMVPAYEFGPPTHCETPSHREWWKLLDVRDRFFSAEALVEYHQSDGTVWKRWSPLAVRFTHPSFMFQRIAFVPT